MVIITASCSQVGESVRTPWTSSWSPRATSLALHKMGHASFGASPGFLIDAFLSTSTHLMPMT
eukprot:2281455-Amphidinium_carterae.1